MGICDSNCRHIFRHGHNGRRHESGICLLRRSGKELGSFFSWMVKGYQLRRWGAVHAYSTLVGEELVSISLVMRGRGKSGAQPGLDSSSFIWWGGAVIVESAIYPHRG